MELKRLTSEYVRDMTDGKARNIYFVDFSEQYLQELLMKYNLKDYLAGVLLDTDNRMAGNKADGKISVCGREIPVYPYEHILDLGGDACCIILNDYFGESYDKLLRWEKEGGGDWPDIYYFTNHETEIELQYQEKYQNASLQNIILFRSGPHASSYVRGMDFADNARALFEYMLAEHLNEKYELVWLVKDPEEFVRYQGIKNVSFLSFDWSESEDKEEQERYYRALCLARYIFFTDAYGFARNCRADQIRVQLWHGCGFKTRVNFVRCEKRYEYTTVISDLYAKIHQDIYGLRPEQVLVTGYAKEDWLFHPLEDALERLGIPKADKYIFWLPTFRMAKTALAQLNEYDLKGQTGLPIADTYKKLEELEQLLESLHTVLIIKLHPFQDSGRVGRIHMKHLVLLDNDMLTDEDIPINRLLGYADGLISDYSSAAVDYMLLDRPIGFTLEDVEEYGQSRGFVFDNIREWLPGAELFSFEQFCEFIKETATGKDSTRERRRRLMKVMHKYRDDKSCRRIVEALHID